VERGLIRAERNTPSHHAYIKKGVINNPVNNQEILVSFIIPSIVGICL